MPNNNAVAIHDYPLSKHANDGLSTYGDGSRRDVIGYANSPPPVRWPNGAKVALNLVLNYEEGGENCLLHGDVESEKLLSEIVGASALPHQRHVNMESLYDYGSRSGYWRLYNLIAKKYKLPCTVFAVGMALERNPSVCESLKFAMKYYNWEVASHGYRWWDYQNVPLEVEREHISRSVQIHKDLLGVRPVGMYQGKPNANTRRLIIEEGGFLYDSDAYNDDLPYWTMEYSGINNNQPHLIIPYTLSENDMRFAIPNGFSHGHEFSTYLKDSLVYLLEEAQSTGVPKMMSVGLHCRLVGRPGRAKGLGDFLDFVTTNLGKEEVWVTTRADIAKHWYKYHYPHDVAGGGSRSSL